MLPHEARHQCVGLLRLLIVWAVPCTLHLNETLHSREGGQPAAQGAGLPGVLGSPHQQYRRRYLHAAPVGRLAADPSLDLGQHCCG